MIGPTRAPARVTIALLLAAGIVLCGLFGGLALAASGATIDYVQESEADFAKQLAKREVASVTINKRLRTMRVTLKDGSHYVARYPKQREPATAARLKANGVSVTVLSKAQAEKSAGPKKSHHRIRYVVGGVLIVAIVLVGGVLLYRRSRMRD